MPKTLAGDGAAGDALHVIGIYSDNYRLSFRTDHPLLIVRCSTVDAEALEHALPKLPRWAAASPRYLKTIRLDDMPPKIRAATLAVAASYRDAVRELDAAGVPRSDVGGAAEVRRDEVARNAGLNFVMFSMHLAARELARTSGLMVDDTCEGTPTNDATSAMPATLDVPALIKALAAFDAANRPRVLTRDGVIISAAPTIAELSETPEQLLRDLKTDEDREANIARQAGTGQSTSGRDLHGELFNARRRVLYHEFRRRVFAFLRFDRSLPSRLPEDIDPGVGLAEIRGWAGETIAACASIASPVSPATPATPAMRSLPGEPSQYADDGDVATFVGTSGPVPAEPLAVERLPDDVLATFAEGAEATTTAAAVPAVVADVPSDPLDAADDALATLRQTWSDRDHGRASRGVVETSHRAFQRAASVVIAKHGEQSVFASFDDPLRSVRSAAGAGGLSEQNGSRTDLFRSARGELADLRRELLIRQSRAAAADAMQQAMYAEPPSQAADPTVRPPDVATIVAGWTDAERDTARELLRPTPVADDARPDPTARDAPVVAALSAPATKSYQQYRRACAHCGVDKLKDDDAYTTFTRELHNPEDDGELPARDTWKRYVRDGRRAAGESKQPSSPRGGREGRSVVRVENLAEPRQRNRS